MKKKRERRDIILVDVAAAAAYSPQFEINNKYMSRAPYLLIFFLFFYSQLLMRFGLAILGAPCKERWAMAH
jgi:hypothetical protein